MTDRRIYIKAATQISIQQPLSEQWMTTPVAYAEPYARSIDPNFREWLNPLESRRMGKILKRALVTAQKVMADAGCSQPDAVITGTGLGCIENTELFLSQLCREGEEMLKPTCFMQSTHNTISSLIAIHSHIHGYNTTFSHKSVSFDSALLDAFTQLRLGDLQTALVTGNDEMTSSYFSILQRTGYIGQPGEVTAGEASVALLLAIDPEDALCELEQVSMHYGDALPQLPPVDADTLLVVGTNGTPQNDEPYEQLCPSIDARPRFAYKRLFGECYTASGLGVYAAAHLLHHGKAGRVLFVNHSDGRNVAFALLKAIRK
jgi:hypothetical protein